MDAHPEATRDMMPWDEVEDEYEKDPLMARVVCDPQFRGGKPYLKEAGLTVRQVLTLIESGKDQNDIVAEYPRATKDDVRAALRYAAWKMGGHHL